MTISRNKATEVARKLLIKKLEEVNSESLKLSEFLYDCWVKSLPKQVLDCYIEHSQYFNKGNTIRLNGNGFNHFEIATPNKVSVIYLLGSCYLDLSVKEADKAKKLQNNWLDKKKQYDNLVIQIQSALYSLRSFKAIEKHFPEAMQYLPTQVKNEVAINFDELRQIIKP